VRAGAERALADLPLDAPAREAVERAAETADAVAEVERLRA
jgi:hypothetical protein